MLEQISDAPATPLAPVAPAPAAAAKPTASPAAKAPPAMAPPADEDADDGADLAGDDFLIDAELQGEDGDDGDQNAEVAPQSPDQRAADVPADPDGYEFKAPAGTEFSDRDQPILSEFAQTAHQLGLSNTEANSLTEFVYKQAQHMREHRLEADKADRATVLQAMDKIWGTAAPANQAAVRQALRNMSPDLQRAVKTARVNGDPNAALLIHTPSFLNWVAQLSRQAGQRPQPQNAGPPLHQIQDHIDQIRRVMKDDSDYFYRHKLDQKLSELEQQKAALQPPASAPGPLRGDAAREKQIMHVMRTNFPKYLERGLQAELAAIRQRAGRS
jgi:hypothetical protein